MSLESSLAVVFLYNKQRDEWVGAVRFNTQQMQQLSHLNLDYSIQMNEQSGCVFTNHLCNLIDFEVLCVGLDGLIANSVKIECTSKLIQ